MAKTQQHQICEMECSRLCNDFAFFVDSHDYEKLAELFVDDGTFERRGEVIQGREAILRSMQGRPKDVVTRHVCTNIRIEPQQDGTALGSCCLLLFNGSAGQAAESSSSAYGLTVAEYRDVYVAVADGWRIRSRVANVIF